MLINIIVIIGTASGVIVLNAVLATWCLFCHGRRRQLAKATVALPKRSSLLKGKHVEFAASVKDCREKHASYSAIGERLPRHVPSPLASAKFRARRVGRPQAEDSLPKKLSVMPLMPTLVDCAPSLYSDDTASVYSAASAPLETHDHLLRSHNSLIISPVTPASEMLSITVNRLSNMEKGLGPEAYDRAIQCPRQQSPFYELSRGQSTWSQPPNRLLPPGLLISPPPTIENNGQGLSSTPLPSPYSPPSKW